MLRLVHSKDFVVVGATVQYCGVIVWSVCSAALVDSAFLKFHAVGGNFSCAR